MAKIENTSERQHDLYEMPKEGKEQRAFSVPRSTPAVSDAVGKQNGSCDVPDDVLAGWLSAESSYFNAMVATGDLVVVSAPTATASDDTKGKSKK